MERKFRGKSILALGALILALNLVAVSQAGAALRHFDGAVLSKNPDSRSFRIETQSGRKVHFRVNATTQFERIAGGFSGLRRGLVIEVDARRTPNGFLAREVEISGRGGDN